MKRKTLTLIVPLALSAAACNNAPPASPESLEQRASYALGFSAGQSLSTQGAEIDIDQLVGGLRTALAGEEGHMTAEEMQTAVMEFQQLFLLRSSSHLVYSCVCINFVKIKIEY